MAEEYTQEASPLRFRAEALGPDDLLVTGLSGHEALSELFEFDLELLAPVAAPVAFEDVLGRGAGVALDVPGGGPRYFQGIISRFAQGARDARFVTYRARLVPHVWLLTKRVRSRIFQHVSVPEILRAVLAGYPVAYRLQGTFHPRDYCVQYRESDWAFAARLMEEEGIYFYFAHAEGGGELVVANTPQGHDPVPDPAAVIYDEVAGGNRGGAEEEGRVTAWQKVQEVRSGQVTLWDHHFELPDKHLEADQKIQDAVAVGRVTHTLGLPVAEGLEVYDYPGGYAGRFDGVTRGGGDQPAELEKIFEDNRRTARLRMQEEAAAAVTVDGAGTCRQLTAGHTFTLDRHFDADGDYVLTRVEHAAGLDGGGYRTGEAAGLRYANRFRCAPAELPFLPPRATPRPTVKGTQTAVVVGPPGDEIFTDKYGRIKVQFHWDREGKYDADSSCWVRVATVWAGKTWGVIHIPRIGQEVVVDFLEGDPDQPIVIGNVYNADQMPPWALPGNKTQTGTLTRSSLGGAPANANAIRFEDKKGAEQLWIHAEKNQDIEVENDETHWVGRDRTKTIDRDETTHVKHDRTETVDNDETITVHGFRDEEVDKDETITIHGNRDEEVDKNETITIHGARKEEVDKDETITIHGNRTETVDKNEKITVHGARTETVDKDEAVTVHGGRAVTVDKNDTLTVGKSLAVTATDTITLTVGKASITMKKDGTVLINGKDITVTGSGEIVAKATKDMTLKGKKILQN